MMPIEPDSSASNFVAPAGWRGAASQRGPVWEVGALIRAVSDLMDSRLNPVQVKGEIASFSRAASGHCYFTLKDAQGDSQIRCAMFKRAASSINFSPRDGDWVELRGKLAIYEARGDLQLIVESLQRAGQGTLFEQFLQRKARLEAQGLFDPERKRALPRQPQAIGVVTSLGAAALQDVCTAFQRRVPHIPVFLSPASVQGAPAPAELKQALQKLYRLAAPGKNRPAVEVILLVRGGGSLDDLWAFNDEELAHTIAQSPVPVVSGVGHETDFTIADFVADLRAPTPTAAAELCATPRGEWLALLEFQKRRLQEAASEQLERQQQRLDWSRARLGRPNDMLMRSRARLDMLRQGMRHAMAISLNRHEAQLARIKGQWPRANQLALTRQQGAIERLSERLALLDPALVLQRGYAWLQDSEGRALGSVAQMQPGQTVSASLSDGEVDLTVQAVRPQ